MNEDQDADQAIAEMAETPNVGRDSLAARMEVRAEQLAERTSEWFSLPGYDGVLEVELRLLGYKRVRKAVDMNRRIRDEATRDLYSMVDNLISATEGFREVVGDDTRPLPAETWVTLAQRLPNAPESLSNRQAALFLLGDSRIMFLIQEWSEWQRVVRPDVDKEVAADFAKTG